jgi:hypothetical protein
LNEQSGLKPLTSQHQLANSVRTGDSTHEYEY